MATSEMTTIGTSSGVRAVFSAAEVRSFIKDGFVIARQFFSTEDVELISSEVTRLHRDNLELPGCFKRLATDDATDPLQAYPRMMHPHRHSSVLHSFLLQQRLGVALEQLLGEPPIAAQSMFYWKPPGARGQALHQDNFYLKVHPGTCLAAWVAIDPADRENGGLNVVPGSHDMDLFCPEEADPEVSFTREFVPVPSGLVPVSPNLAAGDVLFFGGNLIHGSEPNRTSDRFRRSFICHYLGESARELSRWYRPIYRFDGTEVSVDDATGGGPCGDVVVAGPH